MAYNNNNNNSKELRINDKIRVREVRLIDEEGNQKGIVPTLEALKLARDSDLDLVEVSPNANPPVCKILDYGKYKYEIEKRAKESKKKQHTVDVKEIKVRYKIDIHDYNVKINAIKKKKYCLCVSRKR